MLTSTRPIKAIKRDACGVDALRVVVMIDANRTRTNSIRQGAEKVRTFVLTFVAEVDPQLRLESFGTHDQFVAE